MRRLLPLALLAAVVIAGCGSSNSSNSSSAGSAGSVRQTEISYFPAGSPFVISATTDPKSTQIQALEQILAHFPIVGLGEQALLAKLQEIGLDYDTTIKPLLGDPVTVGFGTSNTGVSPDDVLIVWEVPSAAKLQTLLKSVPHITKSGGANGATFYSTGGSAAAGIDGRTVVLSSDLQNVEAAFQRHANGSGFSTSEYNEFVAGLPAGPLVQAFGDLRGVLSSASAASAKTIPWVNDVKGYGVALDATDSSLTLSFRVDTSGGTLTGAQLPIAAGTTAPSFAGSAPITVALTNPGQSLAFIVQAIKLTDPSELRSVPAAGLTAIGALESQLSGNAILSSDLHTTMFRAQLSDPTKAATLLQALLSTATGSGKPTSLGGGFYQDQQITFGIADGQLLIGKATEQQLQAFATAPTTSSGGTGTAAFRVDLTPLLDGLLQNSDVAAVLSSVLTQLGDLTGSVAATPSALTGQASIFVK